MKSMIVRLLASLMLMLAGIQLATAQLAVPDAGHRVTDLAQVLDVSETEALARQLESLEVNTHAQVSILIVPTLQQEPVEAFAQRVFNSWGLGRAGINDGVLMVLSVQDRRVRIHVGRGLEGALPESFVVRVIKEQMGPAFREKQYANGFARGITAIAGPIAEHPQSQKASPAVVASQHQSTAQTDSASLVSTGSAVWLVAGAGVAGLVAVIALLKRRARRNAKALAAREDEAQLREEMRQRSAIASAAALAAAREEARQVASRAREARAVQNNVVSMGARPAPSYPSAAAIRSSASSSSRSSTSSSSGSSSARRSVSSSSSSSSRRSHSSDDDDYSRRSAAAWVSSPSTHESGSSSSNSSYGGGGDSAGGGGSSDY